jgi:mannosyl-oligosaccharide alpha-1,2-mannosidase
MYEEAIESAYDHLIRRVEVVPGRDDLAVIGVKVCLPRGLHNFCMLTGWQQQWGSLQLRLDHLTCFAGGMLGLGAKILQREGDLETAHNVRLVNLPSREV